MTAAWRPQVGDVVAWRREGTAWAFGVVTSPGKVRAEVRVIWGAPSNRASRPYSGMVPVLTSRQFVDGLHGALSQALTARDGASGPGADRGGRR